MKCILNKTISERAKHEFKSYIEGILPDLCADEGGLEADLQSCRGAIWDHTADSMVWYFPNVSEEDCKALVQEVVDFFCGEEEVITAQDCPDCGGHLTLSTTCSECAYEIGMPTGVQKFKRQQLEEKHSLYRAGYNALDGVCTLNDAMSATLAALQMQFVNTEDAQEIAKVFELFETYSSEALSVVCTLEIAKDDLFAELEKDVSYDPQPGDDDPLLKERHKWNDDNGVLI